MNPLVAEYRSLTPGSNHLGDVELNQRKCAILLGLEPHVNDPEVAALFLDVFRDSLEYDMARIQAIQATALYMDDSNPLRLPLLAEVARIAQSETENELLKNWARRFL